MLRSPAHDPRYIGNRGDIAPSCTKVKASAFHWVGLGPRLARSPPRPHNASGRRRPPPPAVPLHRRLAPGSARRRGPQGLWPHHRPSRGRHAGTDRRWMREHRAGATRVPAADHAGRARRREVVAAVMPSRATTTTATGGSPARRCAGMASRPFRSRSGRLPRPEIRREMRLL